MHGCMDCSQDWDSFDPSRAPQAKLSTSAARRLRRKRASQRALTQTAAPKPWTCTGHGPSNYPKRRERKLAAGGRR